MIKPNRARHAALVAGMVAVLASVALVVTDSPASATAAVEVTSCGQTVSSDAFLTRDLRCSGDGVTITGNDTTLSLNGHTLRSTTGTGQGVIIDGPYGSTATVEGPGKVVRFATGVEDYTSTVSGPTQTPRHHVVVDGVQLLDNANGIRILEDLTEVHATTIRATNGITGLNCTRPGCRSMGEVHVDASTIVATDTSLYADKFGGDTISGATVTNSYIRGGLMGSGPSTALSISDSILRGVTVNCDEAGIGITRSHLVDTTVFLQDNCGASLIDNTVRSSKGGTAVNLFSNTPSYSATIDGNHFTGWDTAVSVSPNADGSNITNNRFDRNGTAIAALPCSPSHPSSGTIEHNTVAHSSGDGIALACGVWTVGANLMVANVGLGFNAGPTAVITDAGGNVANRNAEPQCVGLVCTPK